MNSKHLLLVTSHNSDYQLKTQLLVLRGACCTRSITCNSFHQLFFNSKKERKAKNFKKQKQIYKVQEKSSMK